MLVGTVFRGGVAFNDGVKRPGQGVSGTYRYAPDSVLAVGETGCELVFWCLGGLAPVYGGTGMRG